MKYWIGIFGVLILMGFVSGQVSENFAVGEVIVGFNENVSLDDANLLVEFYNLSWSEGYPSFSNDSMKWGVVVVPSSEEDEWISVFDNESIVKYAQLNYIATAQVNDSDCVLEGKVCEDVNNTICCDDLVCDEELSVCVVEEVDCINRCGDGVCDDSVCEGEDCPCVEIEESCPADCSSSESEKSWIYAVLIFVAAAVLIYIGYKIAKWALVAVALAALAVVYYFIFMF